MPRLQGLVAASRLMVAFTQSSLHFCFMLTVTCFLAFPVLTIKAGETTSLSDADDVAGANADDALALTPAQREVEFHAIIETFINSYVVDVADGGDDAISAENIVVFPITHTVDCGAEFNESLSASYDGVDRSTLDDYLSSNSRPCMITASRLKTSTIVPSAIDMCRIMGSDDVSSWSTARLKHDAFAAVFPEARKMLMLYSPGIGRQGTQAIIMAGVSSTEPKFSGEWFGAFLLEKEQGKWKMQRELWMFVQ